jgi:patatin-like phospholipase/acyl hydrolase
MKILSIDGGGYLGLATAAFIAETERHFRTSYHENFDMFCGTSTGAIIALALASGMSGEEITSRYEKLGKSVFYNPFPDRYLSRNILISRLKQLYLIPFRI